ncbi:Ubiquitin carboxyl-terminal hydrolase 12 [Vitis vinifera]|uniref:Ubiquitin carboxyl-terminal hydrolase 12 n=1 Tax=Vitis vinifera TaxID=29760 RepID=A0A438HDI6_VITVI|nr:Ubiquitin carboxyl-terminal hydrolase 12 [Vitis vinifera]
MGVPTMGVRRRRRKRWRLCIYPNGNKKSDGEGHISLYLEISDPQKLPLGWEVTVNFKLFVFNHIHEKYLTVQDADGKVRHFNVMKSRCGFAQFLSLDVLKDPCNGYLMDDSCIFGAQLSLYPEGNGKAKNKSLSLFLELAHCEKLHHQSKLYTEFELLIRDQYLDENVKPSHVKSNAKVWFCDSNKVWGFADMVSLSDLNDKSKDFLLNDSLIVEAKILLMMHSKNI